MEITNSAVFSDQELIERARAGDAHAFEQLFNRYRDVIHQLYMQRTGGNHDDANDLLQEAFVKVFLNLHSYNPRYTFGQWVYTIARNTFIDYIRRHRDEILSIDHSNVAGEVQTRNNLNPEEYMILDQNRTQLDEFMKCLSPRYRQLIELRFFREFSYEEIAAELSLPMGTVKTQIHRAREQLCRLITQSSESLR